MSSETWALGCVVFDMFTTGTGHLVIEPDMFKSATSSSLSSSSRAAEFTNRLRARASSRLKPNMCSIVLCSVPMLPSQRLTPQAMMPALAKEIADLAAGPAQVG